MSDYVDIAPVDAVAQWRSVVARAPRPSVPRWRQVDFLPVETLLCLAAMFVVNHRRFGGATSDLAPSPVPELAALFERTPASVLAKMANLDGSRANGARHEVEAASALLSGPAQLAAVYLVVLAGARAVGIGPERLPDFLLLTRAGGIELLGQDELRDREIESAVEPRLAALAMELGDALVPVTERLLIAAARVGQHRFAKDVLRNCQHRCVFCGLTPGPSLERRGLLVASHIKPWRTSSAGERLDVANGLAACPSHDTAFDAGLLWVNGRLRIHAAHDLDEARSRDPGIAAVFGTPPLRDALVLPLDAVPPGRRYLDWHRQNIAAA